MRQTYENSLTLKKEGEVIEFLTRQTGMVYHKLPWKYGVDCLVSSTKDNYLKEWCEIKCRDLKFKQTPTFMISLDKVLRAWELKNYSGSNTWLYVRFNDGSVHKAQLNDRYPIELKGRINQTRDSQDVEPVCQLPWSAFTGVGQMKEWTP